MNVIDTRLPELLRGRARCSACSSAFRRHRSSKCAATPASTSSSSTTSTDRPASSRPRTCCARRAASGVDPRRAHPRGRHPARARHRRIGDPGAASEHGRTGAADRRRGEIPAARRMRGAAFSTRAAGYGFFGGERHVADSNAGTAVIVMAETREAIGHLDDILAVPRHRRGVLRTKRPVVFARPSRPDGSPEVVSAIEHGIERRLRTRRAGRARAHARRLPSLAHTSVRATCRWCCRAWSASVAAGGVGRASPRSHPPHRRISLRVCGIFQQRAAVDRPHGDVRPCHSRSSVSGTGAAAPRCQTQR